MKTTSITTNNTTNTQKINKKQIKETTDQDITKSIKQIERNIIKRRSKAIIGQNKQHQENRI